MPPVLAHYEALLQDYQAAVQIRAGTGGDIRHRSMLQHLFDLGFTEQSFTDAADLMALADLLGSYNSLKAMTNEAEARTYLEQEALPAARWLASRQPGTTAIQQRHLLLGRLEQVLLAAQQQSPPDLSEHELADMLRRSEEAGGSYAQDVARLVSLVRLLRSRA